MAKSAADLASARAYMARRRAAVKAARADAKAHGEKYTEPTLAMVYEQDAGTCYLCGEACSDLGCSRKDPKRPTMDHVLALSNGGLHNLRNLRLCCFTCNRAKSDALIAEYTAQLAEIA